MKKMSQDFETTWKYMKFLICLIQLSKGSRKVTQLEIN